MVVRGSILGLWSLLLAIGVFGQEHSIDNFCITTAELNFSESINKFRRENRMSEIPLSTSLSFVAKTHVADLQLNRPDTSICTTASWSDKGIWKSCCYNSYIHRPECMWEKPKELSNYPFRGYEIVYFEENLLQPDMVADLWFSVPEVVDFILGKGAHSDKKWAAMGVGIGENYLSLWMGQRTDPNRKPAVCAKGNEIFLAPFTNDTSAKTSVKNTNRYYIIYGIFGSLQEAQTALKTHKNNGFEHAVIVTKDNKIRVALNVLDNLKDAIAAKEKLPAEYSDSWILKD
jgi:hypothetical protein